MFNLQPLCSTVCCSVSPIVRIFVGTSHPFPNSNLQNRNNTKTHFKFKFQIKNKMTIMNTLVSLSPYLFTIIALLIFIEQITYLKKKRSIPGPSLVLPFIGNAISLVRDPTRFWELQSSFAKSSPFGISGNYIIGRFIIFIRDSDLSRKVFLNVRPDAFHLVGHPFGKKLFGEHNLIYMYGQDHKDLRRRIAPNFTPKALSTYTALQQRIILRHLMTWIDTGSSSEFEQKKPVKLRLRTREMNLDTSQSVFVGPYLNYDEREKCNADYNLFNVGMMKLPIDLPGFAFRNASLAVKRLVDSFAVCAERSKERMEAGDEPTCLIDFWMQETVRELSGLADSSETAPVFPSNAEIGGHIFDFLFAAQDASTSSLLWAVTLLDSHPAILTKVRQEVSDIWSPDSGTPITSDQLREMKYTEAVAREVVRFRAPATLVPHIAVEEFQLTESYTIPKGTIVFPSVFESSFQGFTEPNRFDPDRFFLENRQEDRIYKKNFLVFGAGPHQCVGQRYAINHLVLFIALFTSLIDFKRERTDGCDDIVYVPTICPKDDCSVYLSKRGSWNHPHPPLKQN